ncbi:hypothetical protein LTR53_014456 [Teratosphaeriaceae sp. CCFEE 6253]|nr:hypothetical protein LTR53_014456 [Teratosphaeriaceae sp. CCFEE 6253]
MSHAVTAGQSKSSMLTRFITTAEAYLEECKKDPVPEWSDVKDNLQLAVLVYALAFIVYALRTAGIVNLLPEHRTARAVVVHAYACVAFIISWASFLDVYIWERGGVFKADKKSAEFDQMVASLACLTFAAWVAGKLARGMMRLLA